MSKTEAVSNACPMELGINILSGKWKLRILWNLYIKKVVRFNELQRNLGNITTKTLTEQLRELEDKKINFAHFTDIIRLALLINYGGVWIDATILLTDYLPQEYFEMDYFMFQRDDSLSLEEKKDWEEYDDFYFSWNDEMKVRVLNSVIFAKKNNEVLKVLLDMLLIFWKYNDLAPNYFFFQVLYTELIENYYKDKKCKIVSDTLTHEMIRVWFDKFSQQKLDEITERINIHKLTYKIDAGKRNTAGSFLEHFKKMYEID